MTLLDQADKTLKDAKLLAAAPDLIEALQDLMVNCAPITTSDGGLALTDFFRVWNKAQAALIKARGRNT